MAFVRSISGIRATINDDLTPIMISRYTYCLIKSLNVKRLAVGSDGRPSGLWIEQIVSDTALSCGVEVVLLGVVPTPTVQLIVENLDFDAGIVITASHNPAEWNGLKFLGSDGVFLDETINRQIWQIADNCQPQSVSSGIFKLNQVNINPDDYHIKKVITNSLISKYLDSIKNRKFKVVVDAVNASGSKIVPALLSQLECDVIPLHCDSSGVFPHTPEPLPENLTDLCDSVKSNQADLGIAVDPDADRLVIIDDKGECIGEEKTIALAIMAVLEAQTNKSGQKVVVNLSTSSLSEWVAKQYQSEILRAPVGEINVVKKIRESEAIIGGEGSGGVIFPSVHYGRDSLVGIALILSLIASKDVTMSNLSATFPNYYMKKLKFDFNGDFDLLKNKIVSRVKPLSVNFDDGIRCDFTNLWFHIRKSNTEPIIRLIYETLDEDYDYDIIPTITALINELK